MRGRFEESCVVSQRSSWNINPLSLLRLPSHEDIHSPPHPPSHHHHLFAPAGLISLGFRGSHLPVCPPRTLFLPLHCPPPSSLTPSLPDLSSLRPYLFLCPSLSLSIHVSSRARRSFRAYSPPLSSSLPPSAAIDSLPVLPPGAATAAAALEGPKKMGGLGRKKGPTKRRHLVSLHLFREKKTSSSNKAKKKKKV